MRPRLFALLRCPACLGKLDVQSFAESGSGEALVEGVLTCGCGAAYPIVNTIPRMLPDAFALFPEFTSRHRDRLAPRGFDAGEDVGPRTSFDLLLVKTRESFGYQWTTFSEMACDFRENFWNYLHPATASWFEGRLGLDAGCGFGRHIYHAASCGGEMVGLDVSRAIDSTHENTKQFPNVHLVQGDIYAPPFEPGAFDIAYSIGVLHHLPDPARGVRSLANVVKPGGSLFLWLYSSTRRMSNSLLGLARAVTTRLPYPAVNALSFLSAVFDQYALIVPYRALRRLPAGGAIGRRVPPRIRLYSEYPFQVLHADWFDRLAAPIRHYYDERGVREILEQAGIVDIRTSPTGYYGWRGCGRRADVTAPVDPAHA